MSMADAGDVLAGCTVLHGQNGFVHELAGDLFRN